MLFKLIGHGAHIRPVLDEDGKRVLEKYKQGDIVESKRSLDKIFKGKFKRVDKEFSDENDVPDIPSPNKKRDGFWIDKEDESKSSLSKPKKKNPYGKNVTNTFKRTKRNGVRVLVKSGWHTVVDKTDSKPLTDKKLQSEDVQEFIDSLSDDDE